MLNEVPAAHTTEMRRFAHAARGNAAALLPAHSDAFLEVVVLLEDIAMLFLEVAVYR